MISREEALEIIDLIGGEMQLFQRIEFDNSNYTSELSYETMKKEHRIIMHKIFQLKEFIENEN